MMTQEHANTAMAKCTAKIDFFEELTARIDRMIDEIEMARHDNVLWQFGEDWTPVDKIDEFWDATETAREGLGTLRWLCDDQLTRERNKAKVLEAYVTRLDGEAIPTEVTATDTDIDGEDGAHCFDCGKYVADVHDMDLGMWVQPAHERGTVNEESGAHTDRYYAEFVCRECCDKHYHQCDECGESYHESRCTQDESGNWICENCRDAQADNAQADNAQADELTAILQTKTCGATWHVHTRLQGDRGYRSLILNKLTVKPDWYTGKGYNFYQQEVLAHYDTAEQVAKVIGRIRAVATFKETEFNFPHVAELTATDYDEKLWAVDFDIYHEDSDLTEEELRDYTDRLSDAMTANGNRAHVELETCLISVYGDDGGENLTVGKIVTEMCKRGCWVEYPDHDEEDATK